MLCVPTMDGSQPCAPCAWHEDVRDLRGVHGGHTRDTSDEMSMHEARETVDKEIRRDVASAMGREIRLAPLTCADAACP